MSLRDRIRECARFTPENYRPFVVNGHGVGRVLASFADLLSGYPDIFDVAPDRVSLSDRLETPDTRTAAVAGVMEELRGLGHIKGWRDEPYPVSTGFYDVPLLTIERATAVLFGTMAYGVNLNGYVRKNGRIYLWVAQRSGTKPVAPGKLDHIVAGGQPVGISVTDNLIKECHEEAGIPAELSSLAQPVGTLSYLTEQGERLRHSLFFNFDLALPEDFTPRNQDGEVEEFFLWPMEDVMDRLRETEDFKFDVAIGNLDFAIRHGVLGPDDPEYIEVNESLRLGRAGSISAR